MSETDPNLDSANTEYTFYDYHRPVLESGTYEIQVKQTVKIYNNIQAEYSPEKDKNIKFYVAGERFSLQPSDIYSVFPPEGSRGAYADCLSHIALSRSTLPWERSADKNSTDQTKSPPWLALLLFHEDEKSKYKQKRITLKEYGDTLPTKVIALEPGQQPTDYVQVIEVTDEQLRQQLKQLLPSATELSLLCHVRAQRQLDNSPVITDNDSPVITDNEGRGAVSPHYTYIQESFAVVVGKRLPKHGRNTVHLVSLENRYSSSSSDFEGGTTLITLKNWDFYCDQELSEQQESINQLFAKIKPSLLRYPLPSQQLNLESFLSKGFVALPHHLRTGETALSWYRGALIPGKPSTTIEVEAPTISTADALLRYYPDLAMLDITYAAAWELGRLLALQNRAIATSLYQWRHQQECHAHCMTMAKADSPCCHLPAVQCAQSDGEAQVPQVLTNWISDLQHLKGIPFRYLVPDDLMLPPEAIAFFYVDPCWIDCLLKGALSLVEKPTIYAEHCKNAESKLLHSFPQLGQVTGFLMRSAAVAGWPSLIVKGFSDKEGTNVLNTYYYAQLSPNVLIYLFEGEVKLVNIEQKPETLHLVVTQQIKNNSISSDNLISLEVIKLSFASSSSDMAVKLVHKIQTLKVLLED